jgi:DMSO reductase anchor subunit
MERHPNWPAQLFLVFLPAAVGCLLGGLIVDPRGGNRPFLVACLAVSLVLAVVGAAAPVSAIKKPLRSYRLLNGIGHSALSRQAALVALFTALLLVHWVVVLAGAYALWLGVVATAIGVASVLAAGFTYLLRAQPTWRRWPTPMALVAGMLALGVSTSLMAALGWRGSLAAGTSGGIAGRVLVLVGVVSLGVASWDARAHVRGEYPGAHRLRSFQAASIAVAGAGAAASFASSWVIIVAFVAVLAALFVQWRRFFLTAAPLSWRAEVEWYEPAPAGGKE